VTVTIRPMRDDELDARLPQMQADYVTAMIDEGGFAPEVAEAKAASDTAALFPDGRPTPDQAVFVIEADGEPVGRLWLAERPEVLHRGSLWVLELHIDAEHRGCGYGRAAMLYAEEEAERRGLSRIALSVFAGNDAARSLYRGLGYVENAVLMAKNL
jgi:GNAT superfamily N-acetyltransferase